MIRRNMTRCELKCFVGGRFFQKIILYWTPAYASALNLAKKLLKSLFLKSFDIFYWKIWTVPSKLLSIPKQGTFTLKQWDPFSKEKKHWPLHLFMMKIGNKILLQNFGMQIYLYDKIMYRRSYLFLQALQKYKIKI